MRLTEELENGLILSGLIASMGFFCLTCKLIWESIKNKEK